MLKVLMAVFGLATITFSTQASAQIIFDNLSRRDFASTRGAGNSPLAAITVSAATGINTIGVHWDPTSNGNLKFLIFNLNTNSLLFSTAASAFTDTGFGFYSSSAFSTFLLNPGVTYGIGAIADVAGGWSTNNSSSGNPFTQNGITASDDRNGNVSNFTTPGLDGEGSAMIIVQLGRTTNVVPEPATVLLLAGGLAAMGVVARRRRIVG